MPWRRACIELTGGDATVTTLGLLWLERHRVGDRRQHPVHGDDDPGGRAARRRRHPDRAAVVVARAGRLPRGQRHDRRASANVVAQHGGRRAPITLRAFLGTACWPPMSLAVSSVYVYVRYLTSRMSAMPPSPSAGGRGLAGRSIGVGRSPTAGRPQDRVDLLAVGPADRHPVEPLDVLEVVARDLAERPAAVATEVEDGARRTARAADRRRRARRPRASTRRSRRPASSGPRSSRATPSPAVAAASSDGAVDVLRTRGGRRRPVAVRRGRRRGAAGGRPRPRRRVPDRRRRAPPARR